MTIVNNEAETLDDVRQRLTLMEDSVEKINFFLEYQRVGKKFLKRV